MRLWGATGEAQMKKGEPEREKRFTYVLVNRPMTSLEWVPRMRFGDPSRYSVKS